MAKPTYARASLSTPKVERKEFLHVIRYSAVVIEV